MIETTLNTTPGPWYVEGHCVMVNKPERAFLHDGAPETICEMYSSVSPMETTANAKLIAAAPELLAALTAFIAPWSRGGDWEQHINYETYSRGREAIAKATL